MASRSIHYGQNFLRDSRLAAAIVATSSIASSDTVYEIGPGKGILTAELARRAGHVVAIEKDPDAKAFFDQHVKAVAESSLRNSNELSTRGLVLFYDDQFNPR